VDRNAVSKTRPSQRTWASNIHYRDAFYNIVRIVNVQAVIIAVLAAGLVWQVKTTRNEDIFFAETADGRQMQVVGLDLPNINKTTIANWVAEAATQIMTFGFNDINERFEISRRNFTQRGWERFYRAMTESKLIEGVMKAQQIVTAVPKSTPVLLQEGLIEGKYSWVFSMEMLVTFRSGGAKQTVPKELRIIVEQVPTSENPYGVGIGEWYIY